MSSKFQAPTSICEGSKFQAPSSRTKVHRSADRSRGAEYLWNQIEPESLAPWGRHQGWSGRLSTRKCRPYGASDALLFLRLQIFHPYGVGDISTFHPR